MDVLTLYQTLSPAGEIKSKGNGEYCGPCPTPEPANALMRALRRFCGLLP